MFGYLYFNADDKKLFKEKNYLIEIRLLNNLLKIYIPIFYLYLKLIIRVRCSYLF